jgi:hypothetical protein
VTAENITDEQIREYTREHWRDPWPFAKGRPGGGTINDASIIAMATSHPELTRNTRGRFAELLNAPLLCRCGHRFDQHSLAGSCTHTTCAAERTWDPVKAVHVVTLKCRGFDVAP